MKKCFKITIHFLGCPVDHEDNSKKWCSTKVDLNNNHIANQNEWGYCADDCANSSGDAIIIDDTNSTGISDPNNGEGDPHDHESVPCYTVGGPNSGKHCVFPFIWNEKMFNGKFII